MSPREGRGEATLMVVPSRTLYPTSVSTKASKKTQTPQRGLRPSSTALPRHRELGRPKIIPFAKRQTNAITCEGCHA